MQVTILGSGTGIPRPDRASPGFVIDFGEGYTVLVDPSSGSLQRMEKAGLPVSDLRQVFVSHFHPDHIGDIAPLFFALRIEAYFPDQKMTLAGPRGIKELYVQLSEAFGYVLPLDSPRLTILEMRQALDYGNWSVEPFAVAHTDNSLGFRFKDSKGGVFAYSGDTDYCENLVKLLENADVALVESSTPSSYKVEGHLNPRLAGKAAREAGVRRLILTHIYPVCDGHDLIAEVRESGYEGKAEVAYDGMRIDV